MAKILIRCPTCRAKLKRSSDRLGTEARCPRCRGVVPAQLVVEGRTVGGRGSGMINGMPVHEDAVLQIHYADDTDVAVVRFRISGVLDQKNVQRVGKELLDLVDVYRLPKIVLSFEGIEYMSSSVLGKLPALLKKVGAIDGEIRLCCIPKDIMKVFRMMEFQKLFTICKSESKAIRDLA
jgi:anti-anti-sigma factor